MRVTPHPMACARDVEALSRWYREIFGFTSAHGGPHYERLESDGKLVMQLHSFYVEDHHGPIGDPDKPVGNGVIFWFEVLDFDDVVARVEKSGAEIVLPVHRNPPDGSGGPDHREIWFRDPEGYLVVAASPDGEASLHSWD